MRGEPIAVGNSQMTIPPPIAVSENAVTVDIVPAPIKIPCSLILSFPRGATPLFSERRWKYVNAPQITAKTRGTIAKKGDWSESLFSMKAMFIAMNNSPNVPINPKPIKQLIC